MSVDFGLISAIGSIVALIVGKVLKEKPEFSNKFIPWVTLVISVLTQIVEASPANAGLSFGNLFGSGFGQFAIQTLAQWLMTTGTHSVAKNVVQKA